MLSSGSRASTPLKKEADSIRAKLEELGEDAAEVCVRICARVVCVYVRGGGGCVPAYLASPALPC